MEVVSRRVPPGVPLWAPSSMPDAPAAANSARVTISATGYRVALFHCPSALGVNRAGIGTGACGAMASVDGSFGVRDAESAQAADRLVRRDGAARSGCGVTQRVRLEPGQWVSVALDRSTGVPCQAFWRQDTWTLVLRGDLGTPGSPSWVATAKAAAAFLDAHPLAALDGVVVSDLAGDGHHSVVRWAIGPCVVEVGEYHGLRKALALAESMHPWRR